MSIRTASMLSLLLMLWGPSLASATGYHIEPIAFTGDVAPDTGGAVYDYLGGSFTSPVVSDDGLVGFQGLPLSVGRALFVARPGASALVAVEYGTVNGFEFGFMPNDGGLSFDGESRLVFEAVRPPLGWAGLAASPTLVTPLVTENDPLHVPPGTITSIHSMASRHGVFLFEGISTQGWGLFHQKDGVATKIVAWGDPVPGHPGRRFAFMAEGTRIAGPDASGRIAFPNMDDNFFDTGAFLWSEVGGIQTVAFVGDAVPGTGAAFAAVGGPHLNDQGIMVFYGRLDDPDETRGIFRYDGSAIEPLVLSGQPAPGTGGRTFDLPLDRGLDDTGALVFLATLEDGGTPAGEGIFRLAGGTIEPIVLTGEVAPGSGGATYTDLAMPFTPEGAVSPSGTFLAFESQLSDGRVGIFRGSRVATVPALPAAGRLVLAVVIVAAGLVAHRRRVPRRGPAPSPAAGGPPGES